VAGVPNCAGYVNGPLQIAKFNTPFDLDFDSDGNLIVADKENFCIRKVNLKTKIVSTIAGSPGSVGCHDGLGTSAKFAAPYGLCVDKTTNNIFVADYHADVIRVIDNNNFVYTLAGKSRIKGLTNGAPTEALFNCPVSVSLTSNGDLLVCEFGNAAIRKISNVAPNIRNYRKRIIIDYITLSNNPDRCTFTIQLPSRVFIVHKEIASARGCGLLLLQN